jgi:hypothetical protein
MARSEEARLRETPFADGGASWPRLPRLPKLAALPKLEPLTKLPTLPKLPVLPRLATLPPLPALGPLPALRPIAPLAARMRLWGAATVGDAGVDAASFGRALVDGLGYRDAASPG